jgi:hypothetical protein
MREEKARQRTLANCARKKKKFGDRTNERMNFVFKHQIKRKERDKQTKLN